MSSDMNTKVSQQNMLMLKKEEEHRHKIHFLSTQTLVTILKLQVFVGELPQQDSLIQKHFRHLIFIVLQILVSLQLIQTLIIQQRLEQLELDR